MVLGTGIHRDTNQDTTYVSRALLATSLGYPQTPENCRDTCPACIPHVSPRRGAGGRVRDVLVKVARGEYGSEVPWRTRVVTVDSGVEEAEKVLHGNAIMRASYWPAEHSARSFV
jgi:hypothetical protein